MVSASTLAARALALFGAASVGVAQVFLGLVLDNPEHFPREGAFHVWTLAWTLVVPLAAIVGLDLLIGRAGGPRAARAWRALLFAGVLLSFLRQIQSAYPGAFAPWIGWSPPWFLALLVAALAATLALRRPEAAFRYLAALGLLGLVLTGSYLARTGLWGPAWKTTPGSSAALADGPPVFVLVFDELSYEVLQEKDVMRSEHPAFARLARDGACFLQASSNHYWTDRSIATMLTGRLDPPKGAPSYLDLLAAEGWDVLLLDNTMKSKGRTGEKVRVRGRGYDLSLDPLASLGYLLVAFEEAPFVTTSLREERAIALPPPGAWGGNMGERDWRIQWIPRDVEQLLQAVDRAGCRGRVTYWHSLVPHAPFVFDREGTPHGKRPDAFYPAEAKDPSYDPSRVYALYLEQVAFVDRILGRFLDRLEAEGLYEEAVVVVTSDHGLRTWDPALQPSGFPDVQNGLAPRVPLLIKAPGLVPGPRDVDYQHVDLAPTLLRLLGVEHDAALFEGRSALEAHAPRRKIFLQRETGYVLEAETGLWRRQPPGFRPRF